MQKEDNVMPCQKEMQDLQIIIVTSNLVDLLKIATQLHKVHHQRTLILNYNHDTISDFFT